MTVENTIPDQELMERARVAVRIAIEKQKALNVPVIEYDRETKKIYAVYRDGSREELPGEA